MVFYQRGCFFFKRKIKTTLLVVYRVLKRIDNFFSCFSFKEFISSSSNFEIDFK